MNIAIFGWAGASTKHLSKYTALFERIGAENIYLEKLDMKKSYSYKGWQSMRLNPPDWANESIDVAIMFSGGVFPYVNYRIAKKEFRPQKLIFDSGLFFPTPLQITNFIKHLIPAPYRMAFPSGLANFTVDNYWRIENYNWKQRLADYEQQFCCDAKKLIINSKDDPFIIRTDLERFLRNYSGGEINEHLFDKSAHVQHYRHHPREYIKLVKKFINS